MKGANYRIQRLVTIVGLIVLVQTPLLYLLPHRDDVAKRVDRSNVLLDSSMVDSIMLELGPNDTVVSKISSGTDLNYSADAAGRLTLDPGFRTRSSRFKALSSPGYPFVLFSTYRHTLQTFYILGATSVIAHEYVQNRPIYHCEWVSKNSNSPKKFAISEAQLLYIPTDDTQMSYVPTILNCTFSRPVGADNLGGLLLLHISKGPSIPEPFPAIETIFEEEPGSVGNAILEVGKDSRLRLQNEYAFCGPPIHCQRNLDWIQQWLAYHHYVWRGRAHFYFYDVCRAADAAASLRADLEPWVRAGLLTIVEASDEDAFPARWDNQPLFMNDCLHRTRFVSRWTFFHDLNELLYVSAPNTLDSLLEENSDAPWMSFARLPVVTSKCRKNQSGSMWHLERMLWRKERPECMHRRKDPWLCPGSVSRRKIVANPRKVMLVGVHKSEIPGTGGVGFNGTVVRVNHYGKALDSKALCSSSLEPGENPGPYRFDDAIASLVPAIREFAGALLPS